MSLVEEIGADTILGKPLEKEETFRFLKSKDKDAQLLTWVTQNKVNLNYQ